MVHELVHIFVRFVFRNGEEICLQSLPIFSLYNVSQFLSKFVIYVFWVETDHEWISLKLIIAYFGSNASRYFVDLLCIMSCMQWNMYALTYNIINRIIKSSIFWLRMFSFQNVWSKRYKRLCCYILSDFYFHM